MNEVQRFIERMDEKSGRASAVVIREMFVLAVTEFGVNPKEVYDNERDAMELQADADWYKAVGRLTR